jgi:hypothetical protein
MADADEKQNYIREFQLRVVKLAESVYSLRLTNPVDMSYRIACAAMDEADARFPPDEEGNRSPEWKKVKDAFFHIAETVITTKSNRGEIL